MTGFTNALKKAASLGAVLALTGCVVVAPTPTDQASKQPQAADVAMCNIEGKQVQNLSDGTTQAKVEQSCEETVVTVKNVHPQHPKRCQVLIAQAATELYIMPGEERSLTQTGIVEQSRIQLNCVNDWNRTK